MKKLEYIKEDVAIDAGYNDWEDFINDQPNHNVETVMDEVAKRYALEYGQALLQKASEEAKIYVSCPDFNTSEVMKCTRINGIYIQASRESILNTKLDLI